MARQRGQRLARQTSRAESIQGRCLIVEPIGVREFDAAFCMNAACVLHVRPGDQHVRGNGNWAITADGVVSGRQRVGSTMLCDRCAARVTEGDLVLPSDCAA
jgi:hypothetical protein